MKFHSTYQSIDYFYLILQKFDEFLNVVVNGSPTPPVIPVLDAQSEPVLEDVDFLRSYDASLPPTAGPSTNHSTCPYSPSQVCAQDLEAYNNLTDDLYSILPRLIIISLPVHSI